MSLVLTPAGQSLLFNRNVHRPATLWRIDRLDGVKLRFTDHDTTINVLEGTEFVNYAPTYGASSSAVRRESGMRETNRELVGVVSSELITEDDLRSGKYRGARIVAQVVDWKYPWAGVIDSFTYFLDQVDFDGESYTGQVSGLASQLRHKIGRNCKRTCDADLGDDRCKVDLPAITAFGVLVQTVSVNQRLEFKAGFPMIDTAGYYAFGKVAWQFGANAGLISEVYSYTDSPLFTVTLALETEFDIAIGDEFDISPGCDKLAETCIAKFDNIVNFRGFQFLPGKKKANKSFGV